MAAQPPRRPGDLLDQTFNEVMIQIGKAVRAQGRNGRKMAAALSVAKIEEANVAFNTALDNIEFDILRAKATLRRDLELIREKNRAAAAAAAAAANSVSVAAPGATAINKSESSSSSLSAMAGTANPPLQQAPAATMDLDPVESGAPSSESAAVGGVHIKTEPVTDVGNGPTAAAATSTTAVTAATAAMAPFPNMDIDPPAATTIMPMANQPGRPTAPPPPTQAPTVKSPVVKKEAVRSPQKRTKPSPASSGGTAATTPGVAGTAGGVVGGMVGGKGVSGKKAASPVAARVPSPAASRSTASPAKVPSPVLVKSTAGSPAVGKASMAATSQPPTPTLPGGGTAAANKPISLSSSSSSSPSVTTSPVLTKKAAKSAAKSTPKSTTPVPVPRIPTPSKTTPIVPPAPVTVTPIAPPSIPVVQPPPPPPPPSVTTAAPPVPAMSAAPVPTMEAPSNDIRMDDLFDLTGPAGADDSNADLGFTDMQFSLVSTGLGDEAHSKPLPPPPAQPKQTQSAAPPASSAPSAPLLPQTTAQSLAPPTTTAPAPAPEPPQPSHGDDSEFDVEKFAADAAQNLMDTAFMPGLAGSMTMPSQPQQQSQQVPPPPALQQPAQSNDLLIMDSGLEDMGGGIDGGDDLFGFIDGGMDGLKDDPMTSFDDMYMGNPDSTDLDSFFET